MIFQIIGSFHIQNFGHNYFLGSGTLTTWGSVGWFDGANVNKSDENLIDGSETCIRFTCLHLKNHPGRILGLHLGKVPLSSGVDVFELPDQGLFLRGVQGLDGQAGDAALLQVVVEEDALRDGGGGLGRGDS